MTKAGSRGIGTPDVLPRGWPLVDVCILMIPTSCTVLSVHRDAGGKRETGNSYFPSKQPDEEADVGNVSRFIFDRRGVGKLRGWK